MNNVRKSRCSLNSIPVEVLCEVMRYFQKPNDCISLLSVSFGLLWYIVHEYPDSLHHVVWNFRGIHAINSKMFKISGINECKVPFAFNIVYNMMRKPVYDGIEPLLPFTNLEKVKILVPATKKFGDTFFRVCPKFVESMLSPSNEFLFERVKRLEMVSIPPNSIQRIDSSRCKTVMGRLCFALKRFEKYDRLTELKLYGFYMDTKVMQTRYPQESKTLPLQLSNLSSLSIKQCICDGTLFESCLTNLKEFCLNHVSNFSAKYLTKMEKLETLSLEHVWFDSSFTDDFKSSEAAKDFFRRLRVLNCRSVMWLQQQRIPFEDMLRVEELKISGFHFRHMHDRKELDLESFLQSAKKLRVLELENILFKVKNWRVVEKRMDSLETILLKNCSIEE